jgi:hypothetical protein
MEEKESPTRMNKSLIDVELAKNVAEMGDEGWGTSQTEVLILLGILIFELKI